MQLTAKFDALNRLHSKTGSGQMLELFVLSAILIIWIGATLSMRPLSIPDEGRYVGVAWEMVQSNQWLTPTLNGLPYFHKPPLFYWITAVCLKLFGPSEWAARIAPLTGALVAILSIYFLMRRWASTGVARLTAVILATSPFFYGGAQYANHDMLVAGFITATIAFSAHAMLSLQDSQPYRRALLLAWACAALGLLSKGLIGIVLPGGVIFCWMLAEGNWRALHKLCWWPGPLLFTAIALPWFALMENTHPGFAHYFFIEQQFERYVGKGFNNVQPLWFLPAVLVLLNVPWIVCLIARLQLPHETHQHALSLRRLLWIWLMLIVIFFSIPKSKLIGYVLPVLPALSALIAQGLHVHPVWKSNFNLGRLFMIVLAGSLCIMGIVGIATHDTKSSRQLAQLYRHNAPPEAALVFVNVYPFDMAFYTNSRSPVRVIHDWDHEKIIALDSWGKELLEAGRFAPEKSHDYLLPYSALPALLCEQAVSWMITSSDEVHANPDLQKAEIIGKNEQYLLLRLSRSGMRCPVNF